MTRPKPLTESEANRVRRAYRLLGNANEVARQLGFSRDRVAPVVREMRKSLDPRRRPERKKPDEADLRPPRITPAEWRKTLFAEGVEPRAAR